MTLNAQTEIRYLLQQELTRRISQNPRYSLRAFAKALRMSPATLSLILSGKHKLTKKRLETVATVLALAPDQVDDLRDFKNSELKDSADDSTMYKFVTMDMFAVMSDWYHFAILSLMELPSATIEPAWISKKLGISVNEARIAVERLQRMDLLVKVKGKWKQGSLPLRLDNIKSNLAARRFQKQLLLKAVDSLENDTQELRDITSMTFAMNPEDLEWASKKISAFRRRLTEELEKKGSPKAVYNLTVQLCPVTKE